MFNPLKIIELIIYFNIIKILKNKKSNITYNILYFNV